MRKPTIWEELTAKLGREPTHAEACAEVRRILGIEAVSPTFAVRAFLRAAQAKP